MCAGIDDAARDARRRSWRYAECSRTCAASFARMNKGRECVLGEGPDSGDTYPFGCTVLEEVEGARGSDDSGIAERCRVY